jgi:hypothetical protein
MRIPAGLKEAAAGDLVNPSVALNRVIILFLPFLGVPAYIAQYLLMINISPQSQQKHGAPKYQLPRWHLRGASIAAQPSADSRTIHEVKRDTGKEQQHVERRHGWVSERRKQRAVEIVHAVESGQPCVCLWQRSTCPRWVGVNRVEQRERGDEFHDYPCGLAGDIEDGGRGGFAHRVPIYQQLNGCDL